MSRKGFPESYDMPRLIKFVNDVKTASLPKRPFIRTRFMTSFLTSST